MSQGTNQDVLGRDVSRAQGQEVLDRLLAIKSQGGASLQTEHPQAPAPAQPCQRARSVPDPRPPPARPTTRGVAGGNTVAGFRMGISGPPGVGM